MEEHHITVPRTARYHAIGDARTAGVIWMVLHGYGHLARYFLNHFKGHGTNRLIVAPEGLSRFYLDKEHARVGATWMTREDRDSEMTDQIGYLDTLASALLAQCTAGTQVHCLGFSQGVATACRWAMNGNTSIAHLVLWGGQMPPELTTEAMARRWRNVPVQLVHGDQDELVGEKVLQMNEAKLRTADVPFITHRFAGGHELDSLVLDRVFNS